MDRSLSIKAFPILVVVSVFLPLLLTSCTTASSPIDPAASAPAQASASSEVIASPDRTAVSIETGAASAIQTPLRTSSPTPSTALPLLNDPVMDAQLVAPGVGWVETDRAILRTDDDGQTWRDATPVGLRFRVDPRDDVSTLRSLAAVDGETAFLATDKVGNTTTTVTIWRTTDGGRGWASQALPPVRHLTGEICGDGCVKHGHAAVLLDAVDSDVIFAELVMGTGMDTASYDFFRSLNGGHSWTSMPWTIEPKYGSDPGGATIAFHSKDAGTAIFESRIFSTDSGWGHWSEFDQTRLAGTNEIANWYGPVTFLDARHWIVAGHVIAGGNTFPFAESTDAGRTWMIGIRTIPAKLGSDAGVKVTFIDASTWVAAFGGSIGAAPGSGEPARTWVSTDAGTHWILVADQPSPNPFGTDFVDRSHAWTFDPNGALAATSNGGAMWSRILR